MGGYGSGRSGGRPTVEGCPVVLDINQLRGNGCLVPEATCGSQITWPVRTTRQLDIVSQVVLLAGPVVRSCVSQAHSAVLVAQLGSIAHPPGTFLRVGVGPHD